MGGTVEKQKINVSGDAIGGVQTVAPLAVRDYDAAALLGVSQETLRNWRKAGTGPRWAKLSTHTVVYPVDELRSFIYSKLVPEGVETND